MAKLINIDDPNDERVVDYVGLRSPKERRRVETEAGIFVAESPTVIERLLDSDYVVRSLMLSPQMAERLAPRLKKLDIPVYVATRTVMSGVAAFDIHRGAVAVAERPPGRTVGSVIADARTVVVLEGLNDNENVGAIARTARALGVDAMLLDPRCNDPLYRRIVRVSMGAVLYLPFARVDPWPAALAPLRAAKFQIVALTPSDDAIPLESWKPGNKKVAIMLGAEGPGLSDEAFSAATVRVRIPIAPEADSLNVGHAAAIALQHIAAARR